MIDNNVLDQALKKKDKEIEKINQKFEEMKRNYETKIKNLMGSISQLKSDKAEVENSSKDNVRVNIINGLKKEVKERESVIVLLRKYINDEEKVDKYLLKEFGKQGENRMPSYEELKIKIRQMEAEIFGLKHKLTEKTVKQAKTEEVPDNTGVFIKQIDMLKEEAEKHISECNVLRNENMVLKVSNHLKSDCEGEIREITK